MDLLARITDINLSHIATLGVSIITECYDKLSSQIGRKAGVISD
jgi:hypothetical protein